MAVGIENLESALIDGCSFQLAIDQDAYECVFCRRRIGSYAIREYGSSILIVRCGEPSTHDLVNGVRMPLMSVERNMTIVACRIEQTQYIEMYRASSESQKPPQSNELIGQEGGRFDAMYLEEP